MWVGCKSVTDKVNTQIRKLIFFGLYHYSWQEKIFLNICLFKYIYILHGGVVMYLLNEVFYSVYVLEITCNGFRGGKKKQNPQVFAERNECQHL